MQIKQAMDVVTAALRDDPGYRIGWVANIAMAYADNPRGLYESEHAWRNRCAEAFIDLLSRAPSEDSR
jgi:hypothetical protein